MAGEVSRSKTILRLKHPRIPLRLVCVREKYVFTYMSVCLSKCLSSFLTACHVLGQKSVFLSIKVNALVKGREREGLNGRDREEV